MMIEEGERMIKSTGIILAGGKSSRMGTNKALLPIAGKLNIERTIDTLSEVTNELIIVTNAKEQYECFGIRMVSDRIQDKGPLAGMEAGIRHSNTNINVVVACDMPFISADVLRFLQNKVASYDAVIPYIFKKLHPTCAVYTKSVLPVLESNLNENELRLYQMIQMLHVNYIDENQFEALDISLEDVFFNMNVQQEYQQVIGRLEMNQSFIERSLG